MGLAIQIAQLVLCLSILVVLHEWGHYITARIFGMRVEKFYLFFNPYFSLFKKKINETEWGLGWLPLGGYVKISGMIDESMDKKQMKSEPQPWEFRSKPAWQRLIVMLGGVIINAILAVVIYAGTFFHYGEEYMLSKDMKYGIVADGVVEETGLKDGDIVLSIDGDPNVTYPQGLLSKSIFADSLEVIRNGEVLNLGISKKLKKAIIKSRGSAIEPRVPAIIGAFGDSIVSKQTGLQVGDEIVKVNGTSIAFFDELRDIVKGNKNETFDLTVRQGKEIKNLQARTDSIGKLGIAPLYVNDSLNRQYFNVIERNYSFFESLKKGYQEAKHVLVMQVKQFSIIFDKELEAYKEVGSFITITKTFPTVWNWRFFWSFTAMFSIWLAFLNLLPIPGLDGGHAVFAIYEIITGKKPGDKFLEVVQTIGMIFLLTLMAVVLGWDVIKNTIYQG